jgi:hypothetical protein
MNLGEALPSPPAMLPIVVRPVPLTAGGVGNFAPHSPGPEVVPPGTPVALSPVHPLSQHPAPPTRILIGHPIGPPHHHPEPASQRPSP